MGHTPRDLSLVDVVFVLLLVLALEKIQVEEENGDKDNPPVLAKRQFLCAIWGFPPTWDFAGISYLFQMKQRLASAPAEVWNQKNLPSDVERFEESPGPVTDIIKELPAAALGLARRRRGLVALLPLAVLGALGLVWYFSQRD